MGLSGASCVIFAFVSILRALSFSFFYFFTGFFFVSTSFCEERLWTIELPESSPILDEQASTYDKTQDGRIFLSNPVYKYRVKWLLSYFNSGTKNEATKESKEVTTNESAKNGTANGPFFELIEVLPDGNELKSVRLAVRHVNVHAANGTRLSIFVEGDVMYVESLDISSGKIVLLLHGRRYVGLVKPQYKPVIRGSSEFIESSAVQTCDQKLIN